MGYIDKHISYHRMYPAEKKPVFLVFTCVGKQQANSEACDDKHNFAMATAPRCVTRQVNQEGASFSRGFIPASISVDELNTFSLFF